MRNVTSKPEIFDTMEIGYYGNTGLCVHNIFKTQNFYKLYKLVYCVVLILLLLIVVATYSKIGVEDRRTKLAWQQQQQIPALLRKTKLPMR